MKKNQGCKRGNVCRGVARLLALVMILSVLPGNLSVVRAEEDIEADMTDAMNVEQDGIGEDIDDEETMTETEKGTDETAEDVPGEEVGDLVEQEEEGGTKDEAWDGMDTESVQDASPTYDAQESTEDSVSDIEV